MAMALLSEQAKFLARSNGVVFVLFVAFFAVIRRFGLVLCAMVKEQAVKWPGRCVMKDSAVMLAFSVQERNLYIGLGAMLFFMGRTLVEYWSPLMWIIT